MRSPKVPKEARPKKTAPRKPARPKNHPHQIAAQGADDDIDTRHTPDDLYGDMHREFDFTIDVAASPDNAKCERYFSIQVNGLIQSWEGERVWCNPPYSSLEEWVAKAVYETTHGGCPLVVQLLPANRCEQPWWQDMIEPARDRTSFVNEPGRIQITTRFVRGRRAFASKRNPHAKAQPPFGLVLVIYRGSGRRTVKAPPLPVVCLRPPIDRSRNLRLFDYEGATTGLPPTTT